MPDTAALSPAEAQEHMRRRLGVGPARVVEVAAEDDPANAPEIPWHLTPTNPGTVALQLRSTVRRVAVGAGLARRPELLAAVSALDGVPAVVTSPAGGTFIVGGDSWLGLCAIAVPVAGQPMPLDWMLQSLHRWLAAALSSFGLVTTVGRVEGAWCPGFSDVAVDGRKLVGMGFRVTRERIVMRGVMAVRPMPSADLDVLVRCHRLIGVEVRGDTAISLAEAAARPDLTVEDVIADLRHVSTTGTVSDDA